ncbi:MAG TPA: histidinol-phosphate transaminase [Actinomycetes bacterium]|nr:histidinol-phosphate transaminase [Actinomycetes bacterium]
MMALADLPLRDELRGQSPYGAPQIDVAVKLNTNENPFAPADAVVQSITERVVAAAGSLNRYPDRNAEELRRSLAQYVRELTGSPIERSQIWPANGSNEVLQQLLQAFGGPGRRALAFEPSYSMHRLISRGTSTEYVAVSRPSGFALSPELVMSAITEHAPDVLFICSPNNPTGDVATAEVIEAAYAACAGMVVVDEAYGEFSGSPSAIELLPGRERLVIVRTLSKALELAGARLGYVVAAPSVVDALQLVRLPYHLSAMTQAVGLAALEHRQSLLQWVDELKTQRDRIAAALAELEYVVYPSEANFVLFGGVADESQLWRSLLDASVLVRDVGISGHLRVTAGTAQETSTFIDAISAITREPAA